MTAPGFASRIATLSRKGVRTKRVIRVQSSDVAAQGVPETQIPRLGHPSVFVPWIFEVPNPSGPLPARSAGR